MADTEVSSPVQGRSSSSVNSEAAKIRTSTSWAAVRVCVTGCLGGFLYGFSANSMSGTLAQPSFVADFLTEGDVVSKTDGLLGGFLGGCLVGAIFQAPLSNKVGRRYANAASSLINVIAAALLAGSVNYGMLAFARVLSGVGAGMVMANTPVFMSEVSPPHTRGLLVGLEGCGIVTAYIACSLCALIFSFVHTGYQWRLTFVVYAAVSVLHLCSLYFLPESPRWLMDKGREDEAKDVLEKLHKTKDDPTASFAHAEFTQIKAQVEAEKLLPKGYIYIFSTPHLRRRAMCSIILWVMGQGTGITAIANLVPVLMGGLGFGTTMQLGLGVVWTVCAILGCVVNVFLLDRVGRVKLLLIGGFGSAAILATEAALVKFYLNTTYMPGINATVALYFIFGAFFTSTIECTSYVYGSEIWPTHLRSEGSTIVFASFFGNAIAYSAPVSVALENIGWKFYMVFVAVTFASTIVIYFTFPETMHLTLEEISQKFGDEVVVDLNDALTTELGTEKKTKIQNQDDKEETTA